MRIFVTGATGFVGSAVVAELLAAGHQVLGLVRSEAAASSLTAAGATPHRGDLTDLASLRSGAALCDAVIHTAFIHDFSKFAENCAIDREAIAALGATLAGSGRQLVVTSGTGLLAQGGTVTEETDPPPGSALPRVSEQAAMEWASQGVHVAVVRLPPSVHGDGDHGFVPLLIGIARAKGEAAYIGDGMNHWAAVHRLDAAVLYRRIVEHAPATARYHGSAEPGVPFRAIAEVIGRRLGLPVASKTGEDAAAHFGWFTHFAGMGNLASSERTRAALGWQPSQPGLLADIDGSAYFGH